MTTPLDDADDGDDLFEGEKTKAISITQIRAIAPQKTAGGRKQTILTVLTGTTTGQMIQLDTKDCWILGRSTEIDIVFYDNDVSRKHCQIVRKPPDQWLLEDLSSSNGTWINGEKISKKILESEDKIQLGPNVIVKFVLQDSVEAGVQKDLYESATKDALTGLFTKRYFLERLDAEWNFHQRNNRPLSIIMTDIDHFKKINDTHGHLGGDYVLKEVGGLYLSSIRKGDLVGRYGGEEVIFLLRETGLAGAKIMAERSRQMLEKHNFIFQNQKIPVTVSLGIATLIDQNYTDPTTLIKVADEFLYKAKQGGRNRSVCLTDS